MAKRKFFVGFSTFDVDPSKPPRSWALYDIALIKRDLLNQFYTRKGERVMLPNYGSIIWDKLFEGLTDMNRDEIVNDATRIVNSDSRVELVGVDVTQLEHGLIVVMSLRFKPYDVVDTLSASFDINAANRS